jgi:hypothetical protein
MDGKVRGGDIHLPPEWSDEKRHTFLAWLNDELSDEDSAEHCIAGNDRSWQTRPSDHLAGNRLHVHGPIQPMQEPGFLARLLGGAR